MVTSSCEEKGTGNLFNNNRISVWEDEKVLGVDGGSGCTTVRRYFMQLDCTLKNG